MSTNYNIHKHIINVCGTKVAIVKTMHVHVTGKVHNFVKREPGCLEWNCIGHTSS